MTVLRCSHVERPTALPGSYASQHLVALGAQPSATQVAFYDFKRMPTLALMRLDRSKLTWAAGWARRHLQLLRSLITQPERAPDREPVAGLQVHHHGAVAQPGLRGDGAVGQLVLLALAVDGVGARDAVWFEDAEGVARVDEREALR
jgi:hypothetical protein